MVVRDAADWLPEQLAALGRLEARPGRLIAVDNGSTDASPRLLAEAVEGRSRRGDPRHAQLELRARRRRGRGGAAAGVALAAARRLRAACHALTRLLAVAPSADLIFPKLLQPPRRNYPDTLAEVGQSITMGGHRVLSVEERHRSASSGPTSAVLGGSTAGLMVRGTAWKELGGLAPEVARHRDGVDLGWRANAAGWRVVTAPEVALVHRASGRTGERDSGQHPRTRTTRLAALTVVSARGANRLYQDHLIGWIRALGFLLAKAPGHAGAELRALRHWRNSSDQVAALAARLPAVEDEEIADLLPNHFWPLRNAVDRMGASLSERYEISPPKRWTPRSTS